MSTQPSTQTQSQQGLIATSFVDARLAAKPLPQYPSEMPNSLDEAYRIQDCAINLWPEEVAGWKVGRIPDDLAGQHGVDRLAGPIFPSSIFRQQSADPILLEAIEGGFAAVEGEFVIEVSADADPGKKSWTIDEAKAMAGVVYCGIELAGSPFPGINDFGPCITVSDFGNNAGLIIGKTLPGWQERRISDWTCETWIDGKLVSTGNAASMPGGPFESFRFALECGAKRGMPLKKGQLISTGAITGVHKIEINQKARVDFGDGGVISCGIIPAKPQTT